MNSYSNPININSANENPYLLFHRQLIGDRIGINENSSPGETTELNELRAAAAIHLQASTFAECELTSARAALRRAEHRVDSAAPELVALELKLADMADVRKERDLAADALADARRDLEITSGFANELVLWVSAVRGVTSEVNVSIVAGGTRNAMSISS